MKLSIPFICLTLFLFTSTHAQSWQWGARAGSSSDQPGQFSDERVYDMASDKNGNVYVASAITSGSGVQLGTSALTTYASSVAIHPVNILLTSYGCDGSLRWKKLIGGDGDCGIISLRIDTLGHVYLMGNVSFVNSGQGSMRINFGTDTTLPYDLYKRLFIAQYDTSGNYKWLRMPDADTLSANSWGNTTGFDLAVDKSGNLHVIAFLSKGALPNSPYTVSANSLYVLRYNPNGTLVDAIHPAGFNMTTTGAPFPGFPNAAFRSFRMAPTPQGNWVIAGSQETAIGTGGFTINGQPVNHSAFIGFFNSQWQYTSGYIAEEDLNQVFGRPVSDAPGNIYITGGIHNATRFFGDTVQIATVGAVPFVAKFNNAGIKTWISNANDNSIGGSCYATTLGRDIVLNSNGSAVITGGCGGLSWGGKNIPGVCNSRYTVFTATLNTANGAVQRLDTIVKGFGPFDNFGLSVAAGKGGSVFVGGSMGKSLTVNQSSLNFVGGSSDAFVARFGVACGKESVGDADHFSHVRIYPNPARDFVQLNGTRGALLQLYDLAGRLIFQTSVAGENFMLNTSEYAPGVYLLKLLDENKSTAFRLVKH